MISGSRCGRSALLVLISITCAWPLVPRTAAAQAPKPAPCSAPEHRQFDFWIGDWNVQDAAGKTVGRNRIERIEGQCGLQENWTAGAGGGTGRSINAYWPGDRKWHQFWLGSGGLVLHLTGTFDGDTLTLAGETSMPNGQTVRERLRFTKLPDGRVRQHWEQSKDGTTWQTAFEGFYVRQ
jgi:hypothetical protein